MLERASLLRPFPRTAQDVERLRLRRARRGLGRSLVLEGDHRWAAHEHALHAVRAQPKLDASVVEQVELDVAPSAQELPLLLCLCVPVLALEGEPLPRDRHVPAAM